MVILLSIFGSLVLQLTTTPQSIAGNTTSTFSVNISSSTITFSSASAMLNLAHSASIVLAFSNFVYMRKINEYCIRE